MTHAVLLIGVMALVTAGLRFLPFILFSGGRPTPSYIEYLGRVLPPAMIAMLVVYCLKDTDISAAPFGIPELISCAAIILLQKLRRNSLISILTGTALYMILIRLF